ncbi:50S ribosomal protein L19 (plasmid) [Acetobacter orientalis]|uniref:50S ribosomal protein L19 n=1 Tax=Acetobacter orientalis TaxID=146474 RepID=A0A2Z5ZMT7_9PROT|nr:50S ribosomal protein L19 [Acetobacter orientalis]
MTAFGMKSSFTSRDWSGGFRLEQTLILHGPRRRLIETGPIAAWRDVNID